MHQGITSAGWRVVAAAKLLILNPNEFDLWKMRTEQYFLMTDYSLCEVILNGDSPTPTRVVNGVIQAIAPITVEQRLAKKIELKARGTLLMALPDKHQLKFNIHKDVKSLIEAIEKRFCVNKEIKKVQKTLLKQQYENFSGSSSKSLDQIHDRLQKLISQMEILDQSLDDLFNKLKIYEAKVKSSSSTSHTIQNIAFVSSQNTDRTNESVSVVPSVSTASTKPPASILPNVDNLSDAVIYSFFASQSNSSQLDNDDLKQIDVDDLEEMDFKWHIGHADHESHEVSLEEWKESRSQWNHFYMSFQADEEPTNYALMAFTSSSSLGSDSESVPTSPVHDRYKSGVGYHAVPPPYTGTFMPPKPDLVFNDAPTASETIPNVFNVEPSTTKPTKKMSQLTRPSAPIIEDWVFYLEDESVVKHPIQAKNIRKDIPKSIGHKHSWNRKACFVCKSLNHLIKDCDYYEKQMVQKPVRNHTMRVNHQNSTRMTHPHSKKHVVPTAVLTRSRLVPLNAARPVITVVLQTHVKHQRLAKHDFNKPHLPIRRLINHRPAPKTSNIHQKVTTVKTKKVNAVKGTKGNWGNPQQALKDKGYVAFSGNKKGGKITGKGKIKTGKLDFDDVYFVNELKFNLFSVSQMFPRENNMYNVDLNNSVPSGDLTYLFAKATLDESNLWHRRLGHINFKTMNKLVKGNLVRGLPLKVFENNHTCVACKKGKQHRASFVVGNQPNSSASIQENLDAGTVGKETVSTQQYVLLPLWSTGSKDPQNIDSDAAFDVKETEFEVHVSPNSSDKPKKHDEKATREARGKSLVDFTNNFNAAGPFDNDISSNFKIGGKSSFVDPSQFPDDPDMPALEDIIYSDDEEDVGAEADFSNLEKSITVCPIPTTRVYKDHLVTQIISDLSSAPQIRSMTRMVKEQEPKRVHQALKDPSWIEAMQVELLQFKMQKVCVLVDLPKGKRAIGSKWVFRNKKDERGILIRNKD
uniref:GAG-pre-integrase domain-containing protein n=1 Tax=Tanacetum cinerariifolium TaxID=118510 RepID=A0A6L2L927_TANCI|nr:hypothetical protein [Tanacetum cinerariifolium]